jgi:hypothetical protein
MSEEAIMIPWPSRECRYCAARPRVALRSETGYRKRSIGKAVIPLPELALDQPSPSCCSWRNLQEETSV